jgi:hypothetical protein
MPTLGLKAILRDMEDRKIDHCCRNLLVSLVAQGDNRENKGNKKGVFGPVGRTSSPSP